MAARPSRCTAAYLALLPLVVLPTPAEPSALARFEVVAVHNTSWHPIESSAGILTIRNTRWNTVQVELSVGPSSQCDQNQSVAVRTLRRDQAWGVVSSEVICWRREQTPGQATAGWTPWAQTLLAPDEIRDIAL
jgi:hypothetical protein